MMQAQVRTEATNTAYNRAHSPAASQQYRQASRLPRTMTPSLIQAHDAGIA